MARKPTRKLIIRLLKSGVEPKDAVRPGTTLEFFDSIQGGFLALGVSGGGTPKWADFLELTAKQKSNLKNLGSYGLIFVKVVDRWFAIAFGGGFQKLDPSSF